MRELAWMAAPWQEWLKFMAEILAVSRGVSIGGTGPVSTLPYNPAVLEAWAGKGAK